MITTNDARSEETFQCFEYLTIPLMLNHHELWKHLVTRRHLLMPIQTDMKTAFSVNKTNDPIHT